MNNREILHELKLSRQATEKLRSDIEKAKSKNYGSNTQFGRDFVRAYVIPFGEALVEATSKRARGRSTTKPLALGYKKMCDLFEYLADPSIVSYLSLISIFDCFYTCEGDKPTVQEAMKKIGKRLETEMRNHYYYKLGPEEVGKAIHKKNNTPQSTPKHREKAAKHVAEKLLLNVYNWDRADLFQGWSSLDRFHVGAFVIEVAHSFGIIESYPVRESKNKTIRQYALTTEIKAHTIKYQTALENRAILTYPLIDIPKEWENQTGIGRENISGGYYQDWFKQDLKLIRDFYSDTKLGTDAINLLNILSRTSWNIDGFVFAIASHCLNQGWSIGKLNAVFDDPRLKEKMPKHLDKLDKSDPLRKKWRSERKALRMASREAAAKSRGTRLAVNVAREYQNEPRFYLSWSCDYRGRMYPQQSFLTQDSSDFERSLLTFSDGCKLDSSGEEYAAQAVAEAFIGSKVSYADRSRWTRDNKELIQAIAENPLAHIPQWEEVDKPWQFIQLANEWNRVVLQGSKPLWNVPIGADATSSGLQLLSAMRRDPVGMEFSNLFAPTSKNDPPRDAYTRVLEIAKERVLNHKDKAWLAEYLNDRKLGKIILMKKVYGAVWSTNEREVREYFREKKVFPKTIDHECTKYLTDVLRDASEEVFPMAFAALDWIQNLYSTAQKKKPSPDSYTWTTPNLDSIDLKKADLKVKRIETSCYGRTTIPLTEIKEPAYRRMKSSIAPDFIHSYDSCVLKSAFQNWNKSLVVIHDCFKVLPNDMDLAKDRIRHGFVHVCSGDPLARLADDLGVTEEELPRLKQGNARLEDVLNSSYMFN
jgi:hypothetical protein